MAQGVVTELHRWPVKSMGGEPVGAVRLDRRGVGGDRMHVLFDEFRGAPRRLSAREAPRLLLWAARYEGEPDDALDPEAVPAPVLTAPGGREFAWEDPALPGALAEDLGREVQLRRVPELLPDLQDSVLVTTQATLEALGVTLRPMDLRRFRTNVHVVLDAPAYAEEGWEGGSLRIGDAELELLHPCARCVIPTRDPDTTAKFPELLRWLTREHGGLFGINARAAGPARIGVGDPVTVRA